jgi:hypothetical protein
VKLHTASELISLARRLEDESAGFYEKLASNERNPQPWYDYVKENGQNVKNVQRAYNSAISDALESGFAFDVEASDFEFSVPTQASHSEIVKGAIDIETKMARLYEIAAEQSQSLLPDVSRAMKVIHRKRQMRLDMLRSALAHPPLP